MPSSLQAPLIGKFAASVHLSSMISQSVQLYQSLHPRRHLSNNSNIQHADWMTHTDTVITTTKQQQLLLLLLLLSVSVYPVYFPKITRGCCWYESLYRLDSLHAACYRQVSSNTISIVSTIQPLHKLSNWIDCSLLGMTVKHVLQVCDGVKATV